MQKITKHLFLMLLAAIAVTLPGALDAGIVEATVLFTVAGGATVSQTVQICPQYIVVTGNSITALEISVGGQSQLINLRNATQIEALANYRSLTSGTLLASQAATIVPIANGYIPNKNVTITVTCGPVSACTVHGASLGRGDMFLQTLVTTVLENSGQIFEDFTAMLPISPNDADIIDVNFRDGFSDKWEGNILQSIQAYAQNNSDGTGGLNAQGAVIDNAGQIIRNVTYTPSGSNRDIVLVRWADVGKMKTAASFIPEEMARKMYKN